MRSQGTLGRYLDKVKGKREMKYATITAATGAQSVGMTLVWGIIWHGGACQGRVGATPPYPLHAPCHASTRIVSLGHRLVEKLERKMASSTW